MPRIREVDGLSYAEAGPVAVLTLARPDHLNALTFDVYTALRDRFASFRRRPDLRAVILTGAGRGFCSGGDVEAIIGKLVEFDKRRLLQFTRLTSSVVQNMRDCPQPIVAALNGTVAGAGAALALASDFRLAVPSARIAFLFVKAGLSAADMGAAYLLPRLVGLGRATELLLTGDFLEAPEAHRIGLYNRIVAPEQLRAEAHAWATRLARLPHKGISVSKWVLNREASTTLAQALRLDARLQADCMLEPEFRKAYEDFRSRRKPARP